LVSPSSWILFIAHQNRFGRKVNWA
jgi:hypothetical protein